MREGKRERGHRAWCRGVTAGGDGAVGEAKLVPFGLHTGILAMAPVTLQ